MVCNTGTLTRNRPKENTAQCDPLHVVYPARLALTTRALNATADTGAIPKLPSGIPTDGKDDYDLRALRDGYIYILAENVAPERTRDEANSPLIVIPTARVGGKAWYVYRYRSPDIPIPANQMRHLPGSYSFAQYYCDEEDIHQAWQLDSTDYTCIRLNKQISRIDIAFSDFEWPLALLDELAVDESKRSQWMRTVNILTHTGAAAPINALRDRVKDFSFETRRTGKEDEESNAWRFTPIGVRPELDGMARNILNKHSKGAVVALEDAIGTLRDLAYYQQTLDTQRQKALSEYAYAIHTAQIIDAHAKHILLTHNEKVEASEGSYAPVSGRAAKIGLRQAYRLVGELGEHWQQDSDRAVIDALKAEFELDDIPGINSINKLAALPGLYGRPFRNLVGVHITLIAQKENLARLNHLFALSAAGVMDGANAFCLYTHGMLWGINQSSHGQNLLINAFAEKQSLLSEEQTAPIAAFAGSANAVAATIQSFLGALAEASNLASLNLLAYDKFVTTVVESIHVGAITADGTTYGWVETTSEKAITKIYHRKGLYGQEEYRRSVATDLGTSQRRIPNAQADLNRPYIIIETPLATGEPIPPGAPGYSPDGSKVYGHERSYPPITPPEAGSSSHTLPPSLQINDDSYQFFKHLGDKLAGAGTWFGLQTLLMLFYDNPAKTGAGKIANDPMVNNALMIASFLQPESNIALDVTKDGKTIVVKVIDPKTAKVVPFRSNLAAARATLLQTGTLLAALGVMLEIGIGMEAHYQGDGVGLTGAILRGSGATLITLSTPGLSAGITSIVNTGLSALTSAVGISAVSVSGLAMVFGVVGIGLLVVGIICGLLSPSDIERWIKFGYWGNSRFYWGNPLRRFEWEAGRPDKFQDQFDQSEFKFITDTDGNTQITPQPVLTHYQIEMQRFFEFSEEIRVTWIGKRTFQVEHASLYAASDARGIRVASAIILNRQEKITGYQYGHLPQNETGYDRGMVIRTQPQAKFIKEGVVHLIYPAELDAYTVELNQRPPRPGRELTPYFDSIERLQLSVAVANYRGSEYSNTTEPEIFDLTP